MAINKNFVVKNGFEVATDLILANSTTRKVGIGSTNPQYNLDVRGGIGATDSIVSGISTVLNELRVGTGGTIFSVIAGPTGFGQSVGVGTANPGYLLDVRSPVSTGQTALYVQGDVRITGDLNVGDDIFFDDSRVQFFGLRFSDVGSAERVTVKKTYGDGKYLTRLFFHTPYPTKERIIEFFFRSSHDKLV